MQKQVDKSLSTLKGFGLRSVFFFSTQGAKLRSLGREGRLSGWDRC